MLLPKRVTIVNAAPMKYISLDVKRIHELEIARSIREARSAVAPIDTIRTTVGYTDERFRYLNEMELYKSTAHLIKI